MSQQEFERDYELHDDSENQYYEFDNHHHLAHASQDIPSVPYAPACERQSTLGSGASGLTQAMQRSGNAHPQSLSTSDQAEVG